MIASLDRERLLAIAEYDLERARLMFRIQGGAGAKVLLRLKRVATQSGGQTTSTTTRKISATRARMQFRQHA